MPPAKIDPVDTFYSVGSSLFGRLLLFFSAGWVGLLIGRVAAAFNQWRDFLHPTDAVRYLLDGVVAEVATLAFWPIIALIETAHHSVGLFFLVLIVSGIGFFMLVWTEEPAPLWWLILVAVTSLVPVFASGLEMNLVSCVLLLAFWIGLGAAAWWALQKYHPAVVEAVDNLMQGRSSKNAPPPTPRRKAPPGAWPKGVAGFDEGSVEAAVDADEEDEEGSSN